jgi:hypothetical protein
MKSILEKMYEQTEKNILKKLKELKDCKKIQYAYHESLPIVYILLDPHYLSPLYPTTFKFFNEKYFDESHAIEELININKYAYAYYYSCTIKDNTKWLAVFKDKDEHKIYFNMKFLPKELDNIYILCPDTSGSKPSAVIDSKTAELLTVVSPIKYKGDNQHEN